MKTLPEGFGRILIGLDNRVLELTVVGAEVLSSRLCRTHVFPPPPRPGEDIRIPRLRRRRRGLA
jgi:hypothetical protein